jgi:hypothetical protein
LLNLMIFLIILRITFKVSGTRVFTMFCSQPLALNYGLTSVNSFSSDFIFGKIEWVALYSGLYGVLAVMKSLLQILAISLI